MAIYTSNPLRDPRWDELVARHPRASVFHQRGWLKALHLTYGYEPVLLTSTPDGEPLNNGIVLCRVSSWITGTRLVSLPFADHCEPLVDENGDMREFLDWLRLECSHQKWKYVELRPLSELGESGRGLQPACTYYFHELDIRATSEQIFHGFHRDSIQRRIRRAEQAGLSQETGRSHQLLEEFYRLLLMTRRRHRLLPQPRAWFTNLLAEMGEASEVRLARKGGDAIAALLTLRHGSVVTYKYGCSDERFHHLGGMPFLFWRLIEDSKTQGADVVDFGRSDVSQPGLALFKDRFGTTKTTLTYYRYENKRHSDTKRAFQWQTMRRLFSILPDSVSSTAGRLLYRHMG